MAGIHDDCDLVDPVGAQNEDLPPRRRDELAAEAALADGKARASCGASRPYPAASTVPPRAAVATAPPRARESARGSATFGPRGAQAQHAPAARPPATACPGTSCGAGPKAVGRGAWRGTDAPTSCPCPASPQLDLAVQHLTRALKPPLDVWEEAGLSVKRSLAFARCGVESVPAPLESGATAAGAPLPHGVTTDVHTRPHLPPQPRRETAGHAGAAERGAPAVCAGPVPPGPGTGEDGFQHHTRARSL